MKAMATMTSLSATLVEQDGAPGESTRAPAGFADRLRQAFEAAMPTDGSDAPTTLVPPGETPIERDARSQTEPLQVRRAERDDERSDDSLIAAPIMQTLRELTRIPGFEDASASGRRARTTLRLFGASEDRPTIPAPPPPGADRTPTVRPTADGLIPPAETITDRSALDSSWTETLRATRRFEQVAFARAFGDVTSTAAAETITTESRVVDMRGASAGGAISGARRRGLRADDTDVAADAARAAIASVHLAFDAARPRHVALPDNATQATGAAGTSRSETIERALLREIARSTDASAVTDAPRAMRTAVTVGTSAPEPTASLPASAPFSPRSAPVAPSTESASATASAPLSPSSATASATASVSDAGSTSTPLSPSSASASAPLSPFSPTPSLSPSHLSRSSQAGSSPSLSTGAPPIGLAQVDAPRLADAASSPATLRFLPAEPGEASSEASTAERPNRLDALRQKARRTTLRLGNVDVAPRSMRPGTIRDDGMPRAENAIDEHETRAGFPDTDRSPVLAGAPQRTEGPSTLRPGAADEARSADHEESREARATEIARNIDAIELNGKVRISADAGDLGRIQIEARRDAEGRIDIDLSSVREATNAALEAHRPELTREASRGESRSASVNVFSSTTGGTGQRHDDRQRSDTPRRHDDDASTAERSTRRDRARRVRIVL